MIRPLLASVRTLLTSAALAASVPLLPLAAAEPEVDTARGDALLAEYFRLETARVADRCLADVRTLEDWMERREEHREQLQEMLGLLPWPERTPLNERITGRVEKKVGEDEFVVENVVFESLPGLYVTGNLYRPKAQEGPLPAVLYVCGHGRVKKGDVSYGNKASYQHHGAWFARNGYVCLTIDTIQLGEIEGIHHGTHRYGMWWWNNRGYTSAGVEAWNGIRSLDYLQSRAEVDPERIGITGRSGGGAYSWWVAALDERVKAAVPVAGITSMQNHVVDGCIEGHCDCMFMVNTYAWDFPLLAALVAPRPLLISNTDKDRIFPLDGVVDVYNKTRRIYELHEKPEHIGLNICEGPHKDTQVLHINAFHWLNRFLKGDDSQIEKTAEKFFEPEELKVFKTLPENERVTAIHESFVPAADLDSLPRSPEELDSLAHRSIAFLEQKSFRNWPKEKGGGSLRVKLVKRWESDETRVRLFEFTSEEPFRLPLIVVEPLKGKGAKERQSPAEQRSTPVAMTLLDQAGWEKATAGMPAFLPDLPFVAVPEKLENLLASLRKLSGGEERGGTIQLYLLPRGVGPTQWTRDERKQTHIRRRFALLGNTLDSLRVYDTLRGIRAAQQILRSSQPLVLHGSGEAAGWALHAALFERSVQTLFLRDLSSDYREGPYFLNVSRQLTLPATLLIAAGRVDRLLLDAEDGQARKSWEPVLSTAEHYGWKVTDELNTAVQIEKH